MPVIPCAWRPSPSFALPLKRCYELEGEDLLVVVHFVKTHAAEVGHLLRARLACPLATLLEAGSRVEAVWPWYRFLKFLWKFDPSGEDTFPEIFPEYLPPLGRKSRPFLLDFPLGTAILETGLAGSGPS